MKFEFALLGLLAGLWGSSYLFAKVALGERITPAIGLGLAAIILGVAAINARRG